MIEVIYEDNHLIAVNKTAGTLVQGDETGDVPLSELVKNYLKEKYQKQGNVFVGVIHRLDRPVSGVVLFAKTSKALARMNAAFSERTTQKTYWALVQGVPLQPQGKLTHWLLKNPSNNTVKIVAAHTKNAQSAELSYQLLASNGKKSLLEVYPITGRPHQIRVQLASMKCVIVGDIKYGYTLPNADASICLHARQLSFEHPVKKEKITIQARLPNMAEWKELSHFFKNT